MAEDIWCYCKADLVQSLKNAGLKSGDRILLHASLKQVGWVVEGPESLLEAIMDLVGPEGLLMMFASWDQSTVDFYKYSPRAQQLFLETARAFDPAKSRSDYRSLGILPEIFRQMSGVFRSRHPELSFLIWGKNASEIAAQHGPHEGLGLASPLGFLVRSGAKVLNIGSPPEAQTLLHLSEELAEITDKPQKKYPAPVLIGGQKTWVDISQFDYDSGFSWTKEPYYLELITQEYIESKKIHSFKVGQADSYIFDAKDLCEFGKNWLEENI